MLYWIAEQLGFPGVLNLIRYLSFRTGGSIATALFIGLVIGPKFIGWLRIRQGKGQPIRADGPQTHLAKRGTPTMGGLMILTSLALSILIWMDLRNPFVWACLFVTLGFGAIGFLDDYDKVRKASTAGVPGRVRLLLEFIHLIMLTAPIGTFGAVAFAVGSSGTNVLLSLIYLILSFYAVVAIFIVVVLGTISAVFKINLFQFLNFIREEIYIVLGTASSESVLPRLLEKLPTFGCSRQSVGLVLPTGYAFNLDGTSIYMSMGVIFLANAYHVPLDLGQQLGILAIMLLTSKGAATVSGGSFVVFAATVAATGVLPLEGLPILFGVYRFMSIAIATTNVIGNSVATVVTAKLAGEFDAGMAHDAMARLRAERAAAA